MARVQVLGCSLCCRCLSRMQQVTLGCLAMTEPQRSSLVGLTIFYGPSSWAIITIKPHTLSDISNYKDKVSELQVTLLSTANLPVILDHYLTKYNSTYLRLKPPSIDFGKLRPANSSASYTDGRLLQRQPNFQHTLDHITQQPWSSRRIPPMPNSPALVARR